MKKLFLALIIVGFGVIALIMLNKLTHIKIYKHQNGEILVETEKIIKEKKDIDYITETFKKGPKSTTKMDAAKPDFVLKTISTEYLVWVSGNTIRYAEKKHSSEIYEINNEEKLLNLIK